MNKYLQAMLRAKQPSSRYMKPLDDDQSAAAGAGGAAAVDRGDTLAAGAPAVDDQAAKDAEAEAERIRVEEEAKAGKKDGEAEAETETGADGKKAAMIPVERHKAVLDKTRAERDALAEQLKAYQNGQVVAKTNEDISKIEEKVVAKEAEYNKLLVDGEVEKATAAMREIRALERQMIDLKADMKSQAATAQAVENIRYNTAVERLEAAYPALNPDHEDYDKEQVAEIMDLQQAYVARGRNPTEALQKAVKLIMGSESDKQDKAVSVTPRVDKAAVVAAERKADATAKGVEAATKTPPQAAKVGADSDKHGGGAITASDVMKMSQDAFRKIDEKTLAQLRGDEI